jgi:hypothetical protein
MMKTDFACDEKNEVAALGSAGVSPALFGVPPKIL